MPCNIPGNIVWGKPPNHKEHDMGTINSAASIRVPWNKGKLVGQKAPFKLKEIWAIRVRLQISSRGRELALFNLAVDSKLRACDLVQLRVRDACHGQNMASRALILQQKTQRPVQFEITEPTRAAVSAWIKKSALNSEDFLFPSRIQRSPHLSTRQYAESLIPGFNYWDWIRRATARTRCAGRKRR
jgi:integrase